MQKKECYLPVQLLFHFIIALIAAHAIAQGSTQIADLLMPLFSKTKMYGIIYRVIFYAVQVVLPMLCLKFANRGRSDQTTFCVVNKAGTLRPTWIFLGFWAVFVITFYSLFLYISPAFKQYVSQTFPVDSASVVNHLIGGVLAGLGEEPLFRALVIHLLINGFGSSINMKGQAAFWGVSILTGFIFMSAHIGYSIIPTFSILYIDPLNLASTFLLGTIWAMMYMRTKNLWGTILAHSGANIIQYAIGHLAAAYVML